jgi:4-amino-4-deoxy-L-arabinose transferase-like glycosyltransferase
MAAIIPIVPDEAYYWEWSRHLAAGYYDHPPAIALLVRAGTMLAGDSPLGVRLGSIVAGFAGSIFAVLLAHDLGGARAAGRAAVLLTVLPLAGIGLVLATPDVPLLATEALALWAVNRAIMGSIEIAPNGKASPRSRGFFERDEIVMWIIAGLATGAAMGSKYTAVLIPTAIAIAFAASPPLRNQFRRPGPYLACAVASLVLLPVLMWNASHGWISFVFQLQHGLGASTGSIAGRELSVIGGQMGLLTPILLPLMLITVGVAVMHRERPSTFVLGVVAAFIWLFFLTSAVRRPVEHNWGAIAVLPAVVVLGTWVPGNTWARWERAGVILAAAFVIGVYVHALHPWIPIAAPRDPIAQAFGWDRLARAVEVDTIPAELAGSRRWIAADRYQDASELAFHLAGHPTVFSLNIASRPNQFELWPTPHDSVRLGDELLVVLDDTQGLPKPVRVLTPHFSSVIRGSLVDLPWGPGRVVGRRRIWHFLDLIGPLPAILDPARQ